MGRLLEAVVNQVLNAQVSAQRQVAPYERNERSAQRQGYRNGYKPRQLTTRVGARTVRVPQARDGAFSTELFARYQRSEQALALSLMELVVNGVSTRKVARITEELCGTRFAKFPVSAWCKTLDPLVTAWNELGGQRAFFCGRARSTKPVRSDCSSPIRHSRSVYASQETRRHARLLRRPEQTGNGGRK